MASISSYSIKCCVTDLLDVYPVSQDHVDSKLQVEADEAILNGIVSRGSGQSSRQSSQQASQQAPMKILTRPISSGKDPAAGFSFTKAKPIQQFDFRRPKQQTPSFPQLQDSIPPFKEMPTETFPHQSWPLRDNARTVQNVVDVAAHRGPSPEYPRTSILKDPLVIPFPNIISAISRAQDSTSSNATSAPILLNVSSARSPPAEVFISPDNTLIESSLNGANESCLVNITSPNHGKSAMTALPPDLNPPKIMKGVEQPQADKQENPRKPSRDPLTSVAGAPKITKSRRRKTTTTGYSQPPMYPKDTYTEDDLMKLLMYRRRQGQQELECIMATQHQKEAEIEKLRDISNNLTSRLQKVEQSETQKTAELSKIKGNKPIWESKIKRLSDYVKGLTNDHKRLRDDADDLHKQYKTVFVARKELHNALADAQKSAEQERTRSQQIADNACHRIDTLAQTVQHQRIQLHNDESLLVAERERSNRLEDQVSKITASHGQLLELFTGHRDTITGKMDDLLQQAQAIVPPNKASESESHNTITPILEQCVSMLRELHKTDAARPEDLQKLNDSMNSFAEGIARSVEACKESSNSMETEQKQLALAVQDQLRALNGNILSEHALSEQIKDLREVRATVRERLQATGTSLADARREIANLQLKDQEQLRRITALETVTIRAQSQTAETPQTLLRIQELDSQNRDLQSAIVALKEEAVDRSDLIQQTSTNAREVAKLLATTQEQLEAAHKETARSREEKTMSERQVVVDHEQLRKELSKMVNMQVAHLKNEHINALQKLKLEKSPAEEKLKSITREVNMLKAEKEKSGKDANQLQALLKGAQNEKEAAIGTRKAFELHLKEVEAQMLEKNNQYRELQATLNKANDQIKVKDLVIVAFEASQVTKPSSSRAINPNPSVRGARSTYNSHALHRDSHQESIDQSPSVRPATSKSSTYFTSLPSVVKDSQPTDKSTVASLDDLMIETPFDAYPPEGSHIIAGEDIANLFPSTPGGNARVKNFNYSRNSVSHTTVVSETQRRQHQSYHKATPYTATHTTNNAHSQSQIGTQSKVGHEYAMPRSSEAISPTNVTARRRDNNLPSFYREASITRESTQPQGSVQDPRQIKRNTVAAGFNDANSQARPMKVQKAESGKQARALGPIIEDSQSPLLNGRSRKMARRKLSAPKEDKYTRRFAQG